jgi:radical SAM protein with 4Fe4S-binding SPASM domain
MRHETLGAFHRRCGLPQPQTAQIEFTYRCNLRCRHCYCRGLSQGREELSTRGFKEILDSLVAAGCMRVALSGGEPLVREDFIELYAHARRKGLIISVLTNGTLLAPPLIDYLARHKPYAVELTLNGITPGTYSAVTGTQGKLQKVLTNIRLMKRGGVPVVVKANLLRSNQHELGSIKRWADKVLGKPAGKHLFRYDAAVHPGLDGDQAPLSERLSYEEILRAVSRETEMLRQFKEELRRDFPKTVRSGRQLYQCNCWESQIFVSPTGRVRFCMFSNEFGFDLLETPLAEGMARMLAAIRAKTFTRGAKCSSCRLRAICAWCPAKAALEMGEQERPIPFHCTYTEALARATSEARREECILR